MENDDGELNTLQAHEHAKLRANPLMMMKRAIESANMREALEWINDGDLAS